MAFTHSTLVLLIDDLGGEITRLYGYTTEDSEEDVLAADYFVGARVFGLAVSDMINIRLGDDSVIQVVVSAVNAAGTATVSILSGPATDEEVETAYNNQVPIVTEVEARAGTAADVRRWNPLRVAQAIQSLAPVSYETVAAAEAVTIDTAHSTVWVMSYSASHPAFPSLYVRRASEPTRNRGKFQDAGGVWFELVGDEVDAKQYGCMCDGTTDDTAAADAWLKDIATLSVKGKWAGGIKVTHASGLLPIIIPADYHRFALSGYDTGISYFLLDGDFDDFFLTLDDNLGLGNYQAPGYADTARTTLEHFTVYGAGFDDEGYPVVAQKGIALAGRHDRVHINDVHMNEVPGTCWHFGAPRPVGTKQGFRESRITNLCCFYCGNLTDDTVIFEADATTFGLNYVVVTGMELAHCAGRMLRITNNNPSNSVHAISFYGTKFHGNDFNEYQDGGALDFPGLVTSRAIVIEGAGSNGIYFYGTNVVQCGTEPGEYAIEIDSNASGYPQGIHLELAISYCDRGIFIDNAGAITIDFTDAQRIEDDVLVECGSGIRGAISVNAPNHTDSGGVNVVIPAAVSHHLTVRDSKIGSLLPFIPFNEFHTLALPLVSDPETHNNDAGQSNLLQYVTTEGTTYQIYVRIVYQTTSAADFKYSLASVGSGSFADVDLVERSLLPGTITWAETSYNSDAVSSITLNASSDGQGILELYGTLTADTDVTQIALRTGQGTATAVDTDIVQGTFWEVRALEAT